MSHSGVTGSSKQKMWAALANTNLKTENCHNLFTLVLFKTCIFLSSVKNKRGDFEEHCCPNNTGPQWTCVEDWHGREKMLNKVFIFVYFAHILFKYSCSFIKLRLNHWCHMDYFNNVFTTFLCLELVVCVAVLAGSESSLISSKISKFVFWTWTKVLRVWNDMRVSN